VTSIGWRGLQEEQREALKREARRGMRHRAYLVGACLAAVLILSLAGCG
jgi:hypothetical protein